MIIYFTVFCDRFDFSFEYFPSLDSASTIFNYIIDNHSYGTVNLYCCRVDADSWYNSTFEDQYHIILAKYLDHKIKLIDCRFLGDFYCSLCDSLDNDVEEESYCSDEDEFVFFTEDEVQK